MKRIPEIESININDSISPQLFYMAEDGLIYYDKINLHEGRFCILRDNSSEMLFEIGEGQAEISDKGELLHFKLGNNETLISIYSREGKIINEIDLEGIYFDTVKDDYGNYICLGNKDGTTVIKIVNRFGIEAGNIIPPGIMFGSCIYIENDEIYLGGFDEKNCFKVLRFNYIGSKSGEWSLRLDNADRIISKILKHGDNLIMAVTGNYDSLAVLSTSSGNYKEVYGGDMGIDYILDININDDKIYILDGKNIYKYQAESIERDTRERHIKYSTRDKGLGAYQYIMYSRGLRECIESGFWISLFIFSGASLYLYIYMNELFKDPMRLLLFIPCFFWVLHYCIAFTRNMIVFMEKAVRIDKLLSIYRFDSEKSLINLPVYSGIMVTCLLTLIFLPKIKPLYSLVPGSVCAVIMYLLDRTLIKRIENQNKDIIIELLQPEEETFRDYIQTSFETLRRNDSERVCVDIVLADNLKENIIEKWVKSRRGIINGIEEATVQSNRITAVLDMSKRDIKYSRISIIMDYVCFIKREVRIKEIEIAFRDDKR